MRMIDKIMQRVHRIFSCKKSGVQQKVKALSEIVKAYARSTFVRTKSGLALDNFIEVIVPVEVYTGIEVSLDIIFVEVLNYLVETITSELAQNKNLHLIPSNFTLRFSTGEVWSIPKRGINDDMVVCLVSSRSGLKGIQTARAIRLTKGSYTGDSVKLTMRILRDQKLQTNSRREFSFRLDGTRLMDSSTPYGGIGLVREDCWGLLESIGEGLFYRDMRSIQLLYNPTRIGGNNVPIIKDNIITVNINKADIPEVILYKGYGGGYFITGKAVINGVPLAPNDGKVRLEDGSHIVLGTQEVVFHAETTDNG